LSIWAKAISVVKIHMRGGREKIGVVYNLTSQVVDLLASSACHVCAGGLAVALKHHVEGFSQDFLVSSAGDGLAAPPLPAIEIN
jgi:hypothetical protein